MQAAGPWTLACSLWLPLGDRVLSDPGATRDLAGSLAEGVAEHVAAVRRLVPGAEVVVQLDEPSLTAVSLGHIRSESGYRVLRTPEPGELATALESSPARPCCSTRAAPGSFASAPAEETVVAVPARPPAPPVEVMTVTLVASPLPAVTAVALELAPVLAMELALPPASAWPVGPVSPDPPDAAPPPPEDEDVPRIPSLVADGFDDAAPVEPEPPLPPDPATGFEVEPEDAAEPWLPFDA